MILPDLILNSRVNQHCLYSGIDHLENCRDKTHFVNYPHSVSYDYNSRGFRDAEWPESLNELKNSIWCLGDSFTVGIGSPITHTWPWLLQQTAKQRTINVSLDGGSNDWIARKCCRILEVVEPQYLIIQWSYISRREKDLNEEYEKSWQIFYSSVRDPSWPQISWKDIDQLPKNILVEIKKLHGGWKPPEITDEDRRLMMIDCTVEQDLENLKSNMSLVISRAQNTQVIHSFIPNSIPGDKTEQCWQEFKNLSDYIIPTVKQLDWARDYHHYDILTSRVFVQDLMSLINFQ